jgi:hypothetical protein
MFDTLKKNVNEFAKLLVKLDGAQVIGLTRLLQVKVFYDDVKDDKGHPMPRSAEAIIEDCLVKFNSLNREERKNILRIMRATIKGK